MGQESLYEGNPVADLDIEDLRAVHSLSPKIFTTFALARQKSRITYIRQPGYLFSRSAAFRPQLTMGLAFSSVMLFAHELVDTSRGILS